MPFSMSTSLRVPQEQLHPQLRGLLVDRRKLFDQTCFPPPEGKGAQLAEQSPRRCRNVGLAQQSVGGFPTMVSAPG